MACSPLLILIRGRMQIMRRLFYCGELNQFYSVIQTRTRSGKVVETRCVPCKTAFLWSASALCIENRYRDWTQSHHDTLNTFTLIVDGYHACFHVCVYVLQQRFAGQTAGKNNTTKHIIVEVRIAKWIGWSYNRLIILNWTI